jgi:hypothetical protein
MSKKGVRAQRDGQLFSVPVANAPSSREQRNLSLLLPNGIGGQQLVLQNLQVKKPEEKEDQKRGQEEKEEERPDPHRLGIDC